ncbi:aurora kinase B [Biomphalaria pfeifferi]|uniref:Aurora kinase B n=1 Tax=Biomphalaria pfeifferi TaxID=112525 RepID=A0AAD8BSG7_BIOPF|nr:aurora kinase B [Biomphalaria pfeifferi]
MDIFEKFDLVQDRTLGYGHCGRVVLAYSKKNKAKQWAVKLFDDQSDQGEKEKLKHLFTNEVKIRQKLNHPLIASSCVALKYDTHFAICRQFFPNGCLKEKIKSVTEEEAERYLGNISSAVHYMHLKRICHMDIKPANILINSYNEAVLTDFDLSMEIPPNVQKWNSYGGTLAYLAPEVSNPHGCDPFKVDVYAVGVVLWSLVIRRRPRSTLNYLNIVNKTLLIPHRLRIALHLLLHPNPEERIPMEALVDNLANGTLLQLYFDRVKDEESSSESEDMEEQECDS